MIAMANAVRPPAIHATRATQGGHRGRALPETGDTTVPRRSRAAFVDRVDLDPDVADISQTLLRILRQAPTRSRRITSGVAAGSADQSGSRSGSSRLSLRLCHLQTSHARSTSRRGRSQRTRCRHACPGSPRACSGLIYAAVPMTAPARFTPSVGAFDRSDDAFSLPTTLARPVENLHHPVRGDLDVRGASGPVHDPLVVGDFEGVDDLPRDVQDATERQAPCFACTGGSCASRCASVSPSTSSRIRKRMPSDSSMP